jgi:hypothetical protein
LRERSAVCYAGTPEGQVAGTDPRGDHPWRLDDDSSSRLNIKGDNTMSKILASAIITTLTLGTAALFGQAIHPQDTGRDPAALRTITGIVSDSMCGAKHMMKGKTPAECTRACVKGGSDYALVAGGKVYILKHDGTDLNQFAGERVTVTGVVTDNTVTVKSISGTKHKAQS